MKTHWRLPGALALATIFAAAPLPAQVARKCVSGFEWGLAPTLVNNADGDHKPGARARAELCKSGHDLRLDSDGQDGIVPSKRFPYSYHLELSGRTLLVADGASVPHETVATASAGLSVSLSEPAEPVVCDDDEPEEECAFRMANVGSTNFDLGFVAVTGHGQYEASADRKEQAFAGGVEARYSHLSPLVPSLLVTYDRVKPLTSESRTSLGVPEDSYGRWMVRGYWMISRKWLIAEIEAAAFRASGLESALEDAGWRSGQYVAATLGVNPGWSNDVLTVHSIFARYANGQLPTALEDRETWTFGIELGPAR